MNIELVKMAVVTALGLTILSGLAVSALIEGMAIIKERFGEF